MSDHMITGKQMQSILILFWIGSLVVIGYNKDAKQDYWVAILGAAIVTLPLIFLSVRLIHLYPGQNLFEIIIKIFGNVFGKIISFIFVFFAIHLGAMVIKTFCVFIKILNMPETPEILTATFIVLLSVWSVKSGPENIGRLAKYCWPILVISIAVTVFLSFKDMNFDNLKPVLNTDIKSLASGCFTLFALPLGEVVVCLSFFSAVGSNVSPLKIYLKALAFTITMIIVVNLRNILILGIPSAEMFYYPSYQAVSIIALGDFFTRVEVIIGLNLVLAGFIKVCVCLYTASLGLTKILNFPNQKTTVVPCGLLMVTLTGLLYSNTAEMFSFIPAYRIYSFPFEVILPVVILVGAEIQTRKKIPKTPDATQTKTNPGAEST